MARKAKEKTGGATLPGVEGPGVGKPNIPALNEAAAVYKRVRDRRQKLTIEEVESKKKLGALMHEHEAAIGKDPDGVMRYITDQDQEVIVESAGENVKVREYKDPGEPAVD